MTTTNNPRPTCAAKSAWGCPTHAPGHMEAGKPDDRLTQRFEYLRKININAFAVEKEIWSRETFGEGQRTEGVVKHIQKELEEILAAPDDPTEWVDVILLGMDGFWRAGGESALLFEALRAKQDINYARKWEPRRDGEPTFHVKEPA